MRNYIVIGIGTFVHLVPMAFIIFMGVMVIKFLMNWIFKKKSDFKFSYILCEFLWILMVLSILRIAGIIGGNFGISSPFDSYISFMLFDEGFNVATLLNIGLFIPFGFLSVLIFKKLHKHWWFGLLMGLAFSTLIEFMQMFVGRFAQLDDIVMNTLGTLIGYEIGISLVRLNRLHKKKRTTFNNKEYKIMENIK